jgi:hypothetical protein
MKQSSQSAAGSPSDPAAIEVRSELSRMAYFRDLLEQGYRHALEPAEPADPLRSRRLALGIALPELDLVPIWSYRTLGGDFSIPFVDFLLDQFLRSLDRFRNGLRKERRGRAPLAWNEFPSTAESGRSAGPNPAALPLLEERFLPERSLARLCGPGGTLSRILRRCESRLFEEPSRRGPLKQDGYQHPSLSSSVGRIGEA